MSKPGGFPAISRWLSEGRATPPDSRRVTSRIPEGCQWSSPKATMGQARSGLRSLRDRGVFGRRVRGCRGAQPPANGWHPCGMTLPKPGGFPAISRWSSEARAIPPDSRRVTSRIPDGCQRSSPTATMGQARSGLRSLRDRGVFGRRVRGCRGAQPPANGWHPCGMTLSQPGGFPPLAGGRARHERYHRIPAA